MSGATVDPKSRIVIYGTHQLVERAAGDYVQVIYNAEAFTEHVGVDGEGYWIANENRSARVTVALLETSPSNLVLSALLEADRAAPGGLLLPLIVREANGTTLYAAARARIVKPVDTIWSDNATVKSWIFSTTRLNGVSGGLPPTPLNPDG